MDGKVQSPACLKSFQSDTSGIALPLLGSGSAHKPGKNKNVMKHPDGAVKATHNRRLLIMTPCKSLLELELKHCLLYTFT